MKLIYFHGASPNFGDELNPYLWDRVLPKGFLDTDESELVIGIGSILYDRFPSEAHKYVLGTGYGGYTAKPDLNDGTWTVVFVRGPETARMLDLPPSAAICDAAILLRAVDGMPEPSNKTDVAFMPHYDSLDRGFWPEACRLAGIPLIDPRDPVEEVIARIRGTKMLITEAMHGAIVADALRTPWLAVKPINKAHHRKWLDWSGSLAITVRDNRLMPSSMMECYVNLTGGRGSLKGRAGRIHKGPIGRPINRVLTYAAAQQLRRLAAREPQLSRDSVIGEVTERAVVAVDAFVKARS